jgi:hypothetical protein
VLAIGVPGTKSPTSVLIIGHLESRGCLGDVGLMIERIGGGGRAQHMRADLETQL